MRRETPHETAERLLLEPALKILAEDAKRRAAQAAQMITLPPTPTQAENDRAAMGEHIVMREEEPEPATRRRH
jgi:hypothetical protein